MARIAERAPNSGACGKLEIRVVKNYHRIFAAQFKHNGGQIFGRGRSYLLARRDRARKHYFVGRRPDERRSRFAGAGHDLDNIIRHACLLKYLAYPDARQRCQFRRLDNHRVSRHQCHDGLAERDRQRIIPCRNDRNNTERVVDDL